MFPVLFFVSTPLFVNAVVPPEAKLLFTLNAVPFRSAEPTLTELAWVTRELERLLPQARQFVRPGLDEPTAVAMLEWQERG